MKILGSDFDGTLTHGGIDDTKRSILQAWRNSGNKFGIVSGRPPQFLDALQNEWKVPLDFFVALNGAYIIDSNKQALFCAKCETLPVKELLQTLFACDCPFAYVNWEKPYIAIKSDGIKENGYCIDCLPETPFFHQVSVELESVAHAASVTAVIAEKYSAFLNPLQNGRCIDIVPLGVNKAQGLYEVMKFYHATYNDVIAVGDNLNDLDMLKEFKSYAMENGVEEAKQAATYLISDITQLIQKEMHE